MEKFLEQIKNREGSKTEYKSSFQKEAIESIVAFANAKGGRLFIGVNDSGQVVGVDIGIESIQSWINQIKQNTSPAIIPDISTVEIEDKTIAVIEVKEFPDYPQLTAMIQKVELQ